VQTNFQKTKPAFRAQSEYRVRAFYPTVRQPAIPEILQIANRLPPVANCVDGTATLSRTTYATCAFAINHTHENLPLRTFKTSRLSSIHRTEMSS